MSNIFISSDWHNIEKASPATGFLSEDLNANNFKIVNLKAPSLESDATTKRWVLENACDKLQVENMIKELALLNSCEIDMKGHRIFNLPSPVNEGDAVMKQYLDYRLGAFLNKNSVIDMKGKRIVNLADAATATDAVNRQYLERALKQNMPHAIKQKACMSGTTLCKKADDVKMDFNLILSYADYIDCKSLTFRQKGVYKIGLWLRILSDSDVNLNIKLRKNDEDFPIAQHVYFIFLADVYERDHYFAVMHDFEQNDRINFTAKGSEEFSVVAYLKISYQGMLPELAISS